MTRNSHRNSLSSESSSSAASSQEDSPAIVKTLDDVTDEKKYCSALGILPLRQEPPEGGDYWEEDEMGSKTGAEGVSNFYKIVPNPDADEVDLSVLRGAQNLKISAKERMSKYLK